MTGFIIFGGFFVQKVHFISGLPRSGSTLLSAILRQNPAFHAAMSSPVGSLFDAALGTMSTTSEFSVFFPEEKRRAILENLMQTYYADQNDKEVIFDTGRGWTTKISTLKQVFPEAKFICCVRSLAWIMDSFETLLRKNAFNQSRLFNNHSERATVYSRCETLGKSDRMVGYAYNALKEAFYGEHAESLLLIDYEILTAMPQKTIELIYQFIGEDYFPHDFEDVEYTAPEFDDWIGLKGLHNVHGKVEFRKRNTILPPDVFENFDKLSFWLESDNSAANVIKFVPNQ
jgi:sulfotransferase